MAIQGGVLEATGTHTISTLNARPRMILFCGTNRDVFDSIITTGNRGGFFGFACEAFTAAPIAPVVNYCQFAMMGGTLCSNQSAHACYAQTAAAAFGTNTLYQADVTAFSDNGFTLNFTTGASGHYIFWLAITDINATYSFQHAIETDGEPHTVDVGFEPSLVVALGQWRNSGHTLPKSTSAQPWTSAGLADISGGTGILDAEWINQSYSKGVRLDQMWGNRINQPGVTAELGEIGIPFVFGLVLPIGVMTCTNPSGNLVTLDCDPGTVSHGFDYVLGVAPEECVRMECGRVEAQFAEQTNVLTELNGPAEGVVFINMESTPKIQSSTPGRWGFGFATPLFEASYLIDMEQGAMYQTMSHGWISSVTTTTVSYGDTDFAPPVDDIGFITQSLAAGGGVSGFGALRTYCLERPLVSFSGFNTHRPSGTQITTRGGHITPGEGV